jgi:hypothetical protein
VCPIPSRLTILASSAIREPLDIEKMSAKHKGITRIEYDGISTKGWMVRITRNGNRKQKFFNDKSYGGKARSLAAAKDCYADWLAKADPIKTTRGIKSVRNSSGKVGVHQVRNVDARWKNAESFGYCASWVTENGKRQKLSFAWNRYGKKAAWGLACLARENELTDRTKVLALYEKKTGKKVKTSF